VTSVPLHYERPLDRQRYEHPLFAKHPDSAPSGGEGYPVLGRKVALRGQSGAGLQLPSRDTCRDVVRHGHVQIARLPRTLVEWRHSTHKITVTRT